MIGIGIGIAAVIVFGVLGLYGLLTAPLREDLAREYLDRDTRGN